MGLPRGFSITKRRWSADRYHVMWQPSRNFKATFTSFGFLLVSLFLIGFFMLQCGLWVLIPIIAFAIILYVLSRKRR